MDMANNKTDIEAKSYENVDFLWGFTQGPF